MPYTFRYDGAISDPNLSSTILKELIPMATWLEYTDYGQLVRGVGNAMASYYDPHYAEPGYYNNILKNGTRGLLDTTRCPHVCFPINLLMFPNMRNAIGPSYLFGSDGLGVALVDLRVAVHSSAWCNTIDNDIVDALVSVDQGVTPCVTIVGFIQCAMYLSGGPPGDLFEVVLQNATDINSSCYARKFYFTAV